MSAAVDDLAPRLRGLELLRAIAEGTAGAVGPAATMVVVAGLLDPRWRVEVEVEAQVA